MNPKVFISHASEDKDYFVLGFAEKLRDKGIDAWVDKWEMYPGDSLVDKIFEEGIKNAKAIIVILSNNSVDKPWVREEINAGFIKKINQGSKLIPLLIDDCKVPEVLKSTVWERIKDITDYQKELDRIVMAILEYKDKPAIGKIPKYSNLLGNIIDELSEIDTFVLKNFCEKSIESGSEIINTAEIYEEIRDLQIPYEEFKETIEILDYRGYIEAYKVLGGDISSVRIEHFGFDEYAKTFIEKYDDMFKDTCFLILNEGLSDSQLIADKLKKPYILINHIFKTLENEGLVKLSNTMSRFEKIFYVSPELKRILQK